MPCQPLPKMSQKTLDILQKNLNIWRSRQHLQTTQNNPVFIEIEAFIDYWITNRPVVERLKNQPGSGQGNMAYILNVINHYKNI